MHDHHDATPRADRTPARMRVFDPAATAAALPWAALADALRAMLLRRHAGRTASPERLAVPLAGGVLLAMPATDGEFASTKLVTVHPGNPARGLPTLLGEVILMRADTGERLALLDGPTLTGRRTAAMSALAARTLAPGIDGPMLIVGAGVQARAHLEAFSAVLGVRRAWIASRSPGAARALAAHARAMGVDAEVVDAPARVLADARIIVTATTATAPLFEDRCATTRSSRPWAHIDPRCASCRQRSCTGPDCSSTTPPAHCTRPGTCFRRTWTGGG